jgi:hypothetical protein
MQTTALNDVSLVFFSQSKQYHENTLNYAMTASLSTPSFPSFLIIQSGYRVYRNKQGAGQPKNRGSNPVRATVFLLSKILTPDLGPTQSPNKRTPAGRSSFSGDKAAGRETDHSPPI